MYALAATPIGYTTASHTHTHTHSLLVSLTHSIPLPSCKIVVQSSAESKRISGLGFGSLTFLLSSLFAFYHFYSFLI